MGNRLKGRNALVTGAGRGIGKAIALALAEEGANVVVCDLGGAVDGTGADKSPADEVVAQIKKMGVKAIPNYGDVADFKAAEGMIKACVDNFGRIDILVNVAGIDKPRMIFNMSEEEWDRVLNVHLKGTFNLSRHACVLMRQQKYGRIVNTVSDAFVGTVGHVNYGAAKGGIASLTYAIAREMGRYGVTCNAFIPRAGTRMTLVPEVIEGLKKRLAAGVLSQEKYDELTKIPGPESFAPFIAYLCSEAAGNINSCIFGVSGGRLSYWAPAIETQIVTKDYEKLGRWTWEETEKLMAKLLKDYKNPAPPAPPEEKK